MDFGLPSSQFDISLSPDYFSVILVFAAIFVGIVFVVFLILFILKKVLSSPMAIPSKYRRKVFILSVPQRPLEETENKKTTKEILAGIENFYAGLGGLRAQRGFQPWFYGRQDHWSFEIVVGFDRLITFYLAAPAYLEDYLKQQILSQYPFCQIEEVDDYNIFSAHGYVAAGHMRSVKDKMFPILTYKNIEGDPILGILSVLSKLPEGQTAAIQFLMRSARYEWRQKGVKVASEMHQGKSLKQALSSVGQGAVLSALGKPSDWLSPTGGEEKKPEAQYRLSPMEEQMAKSIEEKAAKAGLDVNIKLIAFAPQEVQAKDALREIANAFAQYSTYQYANGFKAVIKGYGHKAINDFIYRHFDDKINMVLNTEEAVSLWHLPLAGTEIPNIRWLSSRKLSPPVNLPQEGLILGENDYRGRKITVRIKDQDRARHMYIIGMTGTGKSWTLANLVIQDIKNGKGVCVVDPHGTLIDEILPYIPKERAEDVVIFDPSDIERPIGMNMLEATTPQEMDFAASEMITIFYKLLPDPAMAGPMFEHYMRNALLALMADRDNPGTLVELARIFTDESFRKEKLSHVTDILVKDFWEREYTASQKGTTGADMLSYVISKTGRFVENEMMRNIIGQAKSGINFRRAMDEGRILLMNLSKGKVGEMNSNLLGLIAVSKLQMAALARAELSESQRKDFYLYIDEFQNFITDSISVILAEARKYKLNLILAHQYIAQLSAGTDTKVRDAVFGNVGTIICCRIGVDDAEIMSKQLGPRVSEYDLMNTEKFDAYVRLLIDNTATEAFNMYRFPLPNNPDLEIIEPLKGLSRLKYGRDRSIVMREILERSKIGQLGLPR
ncbi:MAG: type IV secretion system DNA-binding domain-containing protein [Patescibacteria group bacterium]